MSSRQCWNRSQALLISLVARLADNMAEIADIITKLLERTNEGKVSWRTSVDEKTFTAVVGSTSTLVSARDDALRNQQVQFRILDRQGREIERYDTLHQYEAEIGACLRELYTKAKRVALGVEDQLDELLKALEE